jgi:coenzyme F420-reducing hydrogenase gamma subunit
MRGCPPSSRDLLKVLRIRINATEAEPEDVGQGVLVCTQLRKRSHTRCSGSADSKFNTSRCLRL